MEPLSALATAGIIVQFLEFSSKLVRGTIEVYRSASGLPDDLNDLTVVTKSLDSFINKFPTGTPPDSATESDRSLAELAVNCRNICIQLQNLVLKIKGKGGQADSRIKSLGVAWRSLLRKGELEELEKRLDRHRSEIMNQLLSILREEQSANINNLMASQKDFGNNLSHQIQKCFQETRDSILGIIESGKHTSAASENMLRDIQTSLEKLWTETNAMNVERKVLDLLWFPDLRTRASSITDAHSGTYRWILHDPKTDPYSVEIDSREQHERAIWRERHVRWLQAESGSFYISGKPGSGKSTLMKSITRDPLTEQLLQKWASQNEKNLLLASFFFWSSGSVLQKSIHGLYRSILWEVLQLNPGLIQDVLSNLYRKALDGKLHESNLDPDELKSAFENLISNDKVLGKHRMCFFIDGLDEYDGDFWTMSKTLKSWCTSTEVKICVSSRPHNEFLTIFGQPEPWLRLHELTRNDIMCVIRDQFARDERLVEARQAGQEYQEFTASMVEKAEGVFVWVVLTIRSLLVGIGNSCSLAQLRKRLNAIPAELNAMFRKMLSQIELPEREAAARVFLTMKTDTGVSEVWARRRGPPGTFVYFQALLDDIFDDPEYKKALLNGRIGPIMSPQECLSKIGTMSRRLIGRCQGLIQIVDGELSPFYSRVEFIHRTVSDFLGEQATMCELRNTAGGFQPLRAVALVSLAKAKHLPDTDDGEIFESSLDASYQPGRLKKRPMRRRVSAMFLDETPLLTYEHLLAMSEVAGQVGCSPFKAEIESMKRMVWEYASFNERTGVLAADSWVIHANTPAALMTATICIALRVGALSHAKEEMQGRDSVSGWALLVAIAGLHFTRDHGVEELEERSEITHLLLQRALAPNSKLERYCVYMALRSGVDSVLDCPVPARTPWTLVLLEMSILFETRGSHYDKPWEGILKILLENGADSLVYFIGFWLSGSVIENERHYGKFADASDSDRGKGNGLLPLAGPFYMDLPGMLAFWGVDLEHDFGDSTKGVWAHETRAIPKLPEEKLVEAPKGKFYVMKVASFHEMQKATVTEFHASKEKMRKLLNITRTRLRRGLMLNL